MGCPILNNQARRQGGIEKHVGASSVSAEPNHPWSVTRPELLGRQTNIKAVCHSHGHTSSSAGRYYNNDSMVENKCESVHWGVNTQRTTFPWRKVGLEVIQSHPLCRTHVSVGAHWCWINAILKLIKQRESGHNGPPRRYCRMFVTFSWTQKLKHIFFSKWQREENNKITYVLLPHVFSLISPFHSIQRRGK